MYISEELGEKALGGPQENHYSITFLLYFFTRRSTTAFVCNVIILVFVHSLPSSIYCADINIDIERESKFRLYGFRSEGHHLAAAGESIGPSSKLNAISRNE